MGLRNRLEPPIGPGPVARRWRPPDVPSRQAGERHRLDQSTIAQPASATADPRAGPTHGAGSWTSRHTTQCGGPRSVKGQAAVEAVKGKLHRQSPHVQVRSSRSSIWSMRCC